MCRNIRPLYNFDPPATSEEVHAAALQFVRKISGFTKPSQANQEAFDRAVHEIAHISQHLLDELETSAPPKDREVEAARIANSDRHQTGKKGGESGSYEDWNKDDLEQRAKEIGIEGRSDMSKDELVDALRNH
jgi:hypothetical protein